MRISSDRDDKDFIENRTYTVFFNGVEITNRCIWADSNSGECLVYSKDLNDNYILNDSKTEIETKILKGNISIVENFEKEKL